MIGFKNWYEVRYGMPYPASAGSHELAATVLSRIADGIAEYTDLCLSAVAERSVDAPAADEQDEPNEAGVSLRRRAGLHIHWVNELSDNRVARALALGFRCCVYANGTGPVRRCVGRSPGRVALPLYAVALEIEESAWPSAREEMDKW